MAVPGADLSGTVFLDGSKSVLGGILGGPWSVLGAKLAARTAPKGSPNPQKIDVKNDQNFDLC